MKSAAQLNAEIAAALEGQRVARGKVADLVAYLRVNANGWEEEGDKAEAKRFRKRAAQLEQALAANDLRALRKLAKSSHEDEGLTDADIDALDPDIGD